MSKLKDSLEYFKKYCQRYLTEQLDFEGMPKYSIDLIVDELHHAIDHIIVDFCSEESAKNETN